MARMHIYNNQKKTEKSSRIKLCMWSLLSISPFYCADFPFRKLWKAYYTNEPLDEIQTRIIAVIGSRAGLCGLIYILEQQMGIDRTILYDNLHALESDGHINLHRSGKDEIKLGLTRKGRQYFRENRLDI